MPKFVCPLFLLVVVLGLVPARPFAQPRLDTLLPVRGFCIAAPRPAGVDAFVTFIEKELAPRRVNTLIVRVDYNYQYESHPELRDSVALSKEDVKKLVAACRRHQIRLIPQVNLLGHQSWENETHNLLRAYPQFDETPHVKMPEVYQWPNPAGLYCKSYCPLHPDVHKVVFALVDEITAAFEADAFHAGLDEVFYLGDPKCPRCGGLDPARLFAGEVRRIHDHLARQNKELWMWGDRLLDGKTTGLGIWEASYNNTHPAIDLIPKSVVICDWHYERPDQTAVYFALKGFRVITCPWRNPSVAVQQVEDMLRFRASATPVMKERFGGMMQTVWSRHDQFLKGFYGRKTDEKGGDQTDWNTFRTMYERIGALPTTSPSPAGKPKKLPISR
ncbi:MAG: family 20 glycosylhydrolase [Cytophagales bacterium]|nr:family 20 glycosylhydrolase [Cytophagales bacterium]